MKCKCPRNSPVYQPNAKTANQNYWPRTRLNCVDSGTKNRPQMFCTHAVHNSPANGTANIEEILQITPNSAFSQTSNKNNKHHAGTRWLYKHDAKLASQPSCTERMPSAHSQASPFLSEQTAPAAPLQNVFLLT